MYKSLLFIGITLTMLSCKKMGTEIPDFNYPTLAGDSITSEDLRGKATVVCVWATWCGDCIREIPELNQLVEKYSGNDQTSFIAFSDEDEATVRKSLQKFPFKFSHIVNAKAYTDKLKTGMVKHFPQVLVLDKDLNIVFNVTENKEPIFEDLDRTIQSIIK